MKHTVLFLSAYFCFVSAYGQMNGGPLTLSSAVRLALENNVKLLSAEQEIQVANQRVKEANLRFFPQASVWATATKSTIDYPTVLSPEFGARYIEPSDSENFYSTRLSIVQPIYTGGINKSTYRMAKASLQQAKIQYEAVKRDTVLELKEAFFNLLFAERKKLSAGKWLKEAKNFEGKLTRTGETKEVYDFLSAEKAQAEHELRLAELDFLKALNRELDAKVSAQGDFHIIPVDIDLNKALIWAMELRPELKTFAYRAQMDDIAISLALSERYPKVMLGASYDMSGHKIPLQDNSAEVTLSVRIPLNYDFVPQLAQKRAQQRQGELARAEMQDKVRLEIMRAYEQVLFWQTQAPVTEKNYATALAMRKTADAPSVSALKLCGQIYRADASRLSAIRNQLSARAKLEWAVGKDFQS